MTSESHKQRRRGGKGKKSDGQVRGRTDLVKNPLAALKVMGSILRPRAFQRWGQSHVLGYTLRDGRGLICLMCCSMFCSMFHILPSIWEVLSKCS